MPEEEKAEVSTLKRTIDNFVIGVGSLNCLACTGKGVLEVIQYFRTEQYADYFARGNLEHAILGIVIGVASGIVAYKLYKSTKFGE